MKDYPVSPAGRTKKRYRRFFRLKGHGRVFPYARQVALRSERSQRNPEAVYRDPGGFSDWDVLASKNNTDVAAPSHYTFMSGKRPKSSVESTKKILPARSSAGEQDCQGNFWSNTKRGEIGDRDSPKAASEGRKTSGGGVSVRQRYAGNQSISSEETAARSPRPNTVPIKNPLDAKTSAGLSADVTAPSPGREREPAASKAESPGSGFETTGDPDSVALAAMFAGRNSVAAGGPEPTTSAKPVDSEPAVPSGIPFTDPTVEQGKQPLSVPGKTAPPMNFKPQWATPTQWEKVISQLERLVKQPLNSPFLYTTIMIVIFLAVIATIDESLDSPMPLLSMMLALAIGVYGVFVRLNNQQSEPFPKKNGMVKIKQYRKTLMRVIAVCGVIIVVFLLLLYFGDI